MTARFVAPGDRARRLLTALATTAALAIPGSALAQDQPHYGGTARINVHADAPNVDPLGSTEFGVHSRLGLSLNRLIEWDTGPEIGYGEFVAGLYTNLQNERLWA